jgi:hypothetical protein
MTMADKEDDIDRAMKLLLNQKQIKYIKSQTYRGPSRAQMLRNLLNIGIEVEENERKRFIREHKDEIQEYLQAKVAS